MDFTKYIELKKRLEYINYLINIFEKQNNSQNNSQFRL